MSNTKLVKSSVSRKDIIGLPGTTATLGRAWLFLRIQLSLVLESGSVKVSTPKLELVNEQNGNKITKAHKKFYIYYGRTIQ